MLNIELLADLQKHRRDLKELGILPGKDMNEMLDRFLRDFCDDAQHLTSMSGGGIKHPNWESVLLLRDRLKELD